MPKSSFDFTYKFFRPPQRTVPCHNGLLDIRTKHTIAQDRLIVAEQRILDAERRKSETNLQLLAFEQKQVEKRLVLLQNTLNTTNSNRPLKMRGRSTSEIIFRAEHRTSLWNDTLLYPRPKLSVSLHGSKQNLLSLPKLDNSSRRFSAFSDGDITENTIFTSDIESGEEGEYTKSSPKIIRSRKKVLPKSNKQTNPLPPILTIIPPEEDSLFLVH